MTRAATETKIAPPHRAETRVVRGGAAPRKRSDRREFCGWVMRMLCVYAAVVGVAVILLFIVGATR